MAKESVVAAIVRSELFSSLTREECAALAEQCGLRRFDKGEIIFDEGEEGQALHVGVEGERLPALIDTIEASGVKLVIDHLGRPEPADGINSATWDALEIAAGVCTLLKGRLR